MSIKNTSEIVVITSLAILRTPHCTKNMSISYRQNYRKTNTNSSGLGISNLCGKLHNRIFCIYKSSQPTGDHPLWPCQSRVGNEFVYTCIE